MTGPTLYRQIQTFLSIARGSIAMVLSIMVTLKCPQRANGSGLLWVGWIFEKNVLNHSQDISKQIVHYWSPLTSYLHCLSNLGWSWFKYLCIGMERDHKTVADRRQWPYMSSNCHCSSDLYVCTFWLQFTGNGQQADMVRGKLNNNDRCMTRTRIHRSLCLCQFLRILVKVLTLFTNASMAWWWLPYTGTIRLSIEL